MDDNKDDNDEIEKILRWRVSNNQIRNVQYSVDDQVKRTVSYLVQQIDLIHAKGKLYRVVLRFTMM